MKKQSTEEMVMHIRAILEQNHNPEELVGKEDVRTLSLEALIANSLEEAVSMAVQNADESLFQNVDTAVYCKRWQNYEGDAADIMDMYSITRSTHGEGMSISKLVMPKDRYVIYNGELVDVTDDSPVGMQVYDNLSAASNENGAFLVLNDRFIRQYHGGILQIQPNVQRILQLGSDNWNGVVKDLLDKSSSIYRMCHSRYLAAVGVKDRPVAFNDFSSGRRRIEIFPASSKWVSVNYIPKPVIREDWLVDDVREIDPETYLPTDDGGKIGVIECDDSLYEGACFYCASLVAMVLGWQNANTYRQEAVEALSMITRESVRLAANKLAADN